MHAHMQILSDIIPVVQQFHHTCTRILTKIPVASGEAAGEGYTGSCSCRPARRRLSSIWSFSVRRSSLHGIRQSAERLNRPI